jgi:peptidoglycan/xylan/chitin deacetylase (PgdA/CDA1 family)
LALQYGEQEMKLTSPSALVYHGIASSAAKRDPAGISLTRGMFERQMRWLAQRGWHSLDLDAYLAGRFGKGSHRRSILLTFDDGYVSTLEHAFPIMRNLGFPGVLFVPPAMVGETARWLDNEPETPLVDAQQLRALADLGIEVGAHGMEHVFMPGLSDEELRRNTHDAREALADLLGAAPRAFAYPQGRFDERVAAAVERAGFIVAFALTEDGGRFAVPRVEIGASDDMRTFRLKLLPGYGAMSRTLHHFPTLRRRIRRVVGK